MNDFMCLCIVSSLSCLSGKNDSNLVVGRRTLGFIMQSTLNFAVLGLPSLCAIHVLMFTHGT